MSAPLLDTLNAMNLDEFSAYIDSLIKRTMDGGMLTREETLGLLALKPDSAHALRLEAKAKNMAHSITRGRGKVWSALGVDKRPCGMNCTFCSFGEKWGLIQKASEWASEDILEAARLAGEGGASWFVLRTTEFFSLERLAALAVSVRSVLPASCLLVVNTGELSAETASLLLKSGVRGVYHTLRLGEGKDTRFEPAERLATLASVRDSKLELYHMIEPLGIEHTDEEIADRLFVGREYRSMLGGVMARINVKGTPFGGTPAIAEARLAQITALCRLFAGNSMPDICTVPPTRRVLEAGANVVTIEIGAIPRSSQIEHNTAWNGFGLTEAKELLKSAGYQV